MNPSRSLASADCGKSNVVRHLIRADVRGLYFDQEASATLYASVDCLKLDDYTDRSIYAAILQALAGNAPALGDVGETLATQFNAWWDEVVASDRAPIARRRVEQALDALLDGPAKRVILLFDDCDEMIPRASPAFLRSLRSLRDDHKLRLMYITVTRRELVRLREPSPDFESFFELLAAHLIALKPYEKRDAYFMLERLAARNGRTLSASEIRRLYQVTGGHAGLLRVVFEAVKHSDRALDPNFVDYLNDKRVVYDESGKIWDSVESDERADLISLAAGHAPSGEGIPPLLTKGIVVRDPVMGLTIFSPLFALFVAGTVRRRAPAVATPVLPVVYKFNASNGSVRVGDRSIQLAPIEAELFNFLMQRCDRPVEANEMVPLLMTIDPGANPYGRVDQNLSRLRDRVNASGNLIVLKHPDNQWQVVCASAE